MTFITKRGRCTRRETHKDNSFRDRVKKTAALHKHLNTLSPGHWSTCTPPLLSSSQKLFSPHLFSSSRRVCFSVSDLLLPPRRDSDSLSFMLEVLKKKRKTKTTKKTLNPLPRLPSFLLFLLNVDRIAVSKKKRRKTIKKRKKEENACHWK